MLLFLDIILLPMLFFIGLITSYEDLKSGKVRNKWIRLGLIWGLGIFILLMIWYFIATPISRFFYFEILQRPADSPVPVLTFHFSFLLKSLANAALAALIGFLMWKFKAWAAGDAKLFIVYSLLMPIFHYQQSYFVVFPSFVLLTNVFLIFLFYLLASSAFFSLKLILKKIKEAGWNIFRPAAREKSEQSWPKKIGRLAKKAALMMLFPVSVLLLFNFLQPLAMKYFSFDLQPFQSAIFAGLIIFGQKIMPILRKPLAVKIIVSILILVCFYGFWADFAATLGVIWRTLKNMAVFMAIFLLFQKLVNFYIEKTRGLILPIDQLRPGMMIDPSIFKEIDLTAGTNLPDSGLNEEQISVIKTEFAKRNKTKIEIHRTCSFAPWLFLGVITTLIIEKSLLGWLLSMIKM